MSRADDMRDRAFGKGRWYSPTQNSEEQANMDIWNRYGTKIPYPKYRMSPMNISGISSIQDQLRPQETNMYDITTGKSVGAGYTDDIEFRSEPDIGRNEWNQHLRKAWGETPIDYQNIGGKTVATRTLDSSGVQGYSKWGQGTDGGVNGQPLTQTYILPEGALDFKFAQSNAPLSDAQRGNSYRFGGNYSNATVEKSPTRFTSNDLNMGFANNQAVSGGLSDYTTGESFLPASDGYGSSYGRFGGSQAGFTDRSGYTSQRIEKTPKQKSEDEWAQSKGFKSYQDYLNRK